MRDKAFFNRRFLNAFLTVGVALALTACASARQQTKSENDLNVILEISVTDQADQTEVVIVGQKPLIYTSYQLTEPQRLVVDLAGVSVGKYTSRMPVGQGAVVDIVPIEGEKPSHVARVEITLSEAVLSRVRAEGDKLRIEIEKPVGAQGEPPPADGAPPPTEVIPEPAVPAPPVIEETPLQTEPMLSAATVVSTVSLNPEDERLEVTITTDGAVKPEIFMVGGNRLVMDLPELTSAVRPNTLQVKHPLLKRIRIGQHVQPKKVRVVFDLNGSVAYQVEESGPKIRVAFTAAQAAPAPEGVAEKPVKAPVESAPAAAAAPVAPQDETPAVPVPAPVTTEEAKTETPPAAEPEKPMTPSFVSKPKPAEPSEVAPRKKYAGRKVSLDFQDADISNVLRLLADVSGLNIVIGEDVKGKVTLKLINVPWDQALEIVLKMNNLGQVREGNIIRVATLANISRQQDEEARAKETKVKAEDLVTRVVYVNYARAEDLAEPLKKNLSPRGDITIDKRTNTMIIKDINRNVDEVTALIKTLDTRTPQVQIEARIVQADTSFARSLGIQWGAGFTSVRSNNVFGIQGINTASETAPGFGVFAPDFAVNLPGTVSNLNAVPAVGFNFGRFTDSPINLDLRLTAGELNGLTKTISSPKVTTLDNVKAKIEQGESIPFQTTSTQGTQTTFVDANLTLEVTPHITADESIIMKVKAARNSIGSFSGPAGPSISKREAITEVLVKNGDTTVIGGIFVDETTDTETGVPLLSKIPILGWFFKSESKTDTKNELLIFLTPKIVKD